MKTMTMLMTMDHRDKNEIIDNDLNDEGDKETKNDETEEQR